MSLKANKTYNLEQASNKSKDFNTNTDLKVSKKFPSNNSNNNIQDDNICK